MEVNWSNIKIRASSLGNIMTSARDAAVKNNGGLGKTCITELTRVYALEKYGRKKDITTKHMEKGIQCENDGITLLSEVENTFYKKNEERIENEFFSGHPDIFEGKEIRKAKAISDIKISWDLETFLKNEVEELNKQYYWQLQSYLDLCSCKKAYLDYCLVSAPIQIIEQEKRSLLWRMNVVSEDNEEYKIAAAELEHNMIFDDIKKQERVIRIEVLRNDEDIELAHQKVIKCREWLAEFDRKRTSRYK